jgi:hypothetical protein
MPDMIDDYTKLLFGSVIAYGIVFCALLFGGGVALSEPWAIQMAVVVAGSAYVTQIAASHYPPAAYGGWAVALLAGVSGLIALFGG